MSVLTCRKIAVLDSITFTLQLRRLNGAHFTSLEKASSVPGRMQTAVVRSSGEANPRVPVLKSIIRPNRSLLATSSAHSGQCERYAGVSFGSRCAGSVWGAGDGLNA